MILIGKKILKSFKGKGGGFKMAQSHEKICIIDMIEIFQGPFQLSEHVLKNSPCPRKKTCKLKKRLDNIERYVISKLEDIKLASLL